MLASCPPPPAEPVLPEDSEVMEVVLLLPRSQAAALEEAARRWGLTTGQVLRGLIRKFLAGVGTGPSGACPPAADS